MERHAQACARAAQLIAGADALIVTAGAGMSVDSGLPDFRGDAGLWRAYPALQDAGLSFERLASSAMLAQQPVIAHPEGCEYLTPVLETALADRGYTLADGTLTADTDAGNEEDEDDEDDPFALLTGVPFPDQVVVIRSAGNPQGLEIWVGFAPVFD